MADNILKLLEELDRPVFAQIQRVLQDLSEGLVHEEGVSLDFYLDHADLAEETTTVIRYFLNGA